MTEAELVAIRDRFFAAAQRRSDDAELRGVVDRIATASTVVVEGLDVSWHPTVRHKALRFVDAERLPEGVAHLFARPSVEAPHLAAVFADPRELSFRTYENIIPLDRMFGDAKVELADRKRLAEGIYRFAIQPGAALASALGRLDNLGLYMPPLNAGSRGGERFIFHSAALAEGLTEAVRAAMPRSLLGGFVHVNPVFRCNRFEPGDAKFHKHLDTPYYDAARNHISKYTVLLYLTGGDGTPALAIGDTTIDRIEPMTAIVLPQDREHEGAPFVDGRKVFLRTELIFEDPKLAHDDRIGALFSKAIYWTGESIFEPELAAYADRYYNQVAGAHWRGLPDGAVADEPVAHKTFCGVQFSTNGYDYVFTKQPGITLTECAALAVLDYFNAKVDGRSFRETCTTFDKQHLFPAPEQPDKAICCPFHTWPYDATRHDEIIELYQSTQTFAKAHIEPAPILIMGDRVAIDPAKFIVEGDRIHIQSDAKLAPVNFAACWNSGGSPDNYIDVERTVEAVQLLVPPIRFRETADRYHLMLDFFRNTWMIQHDQVSVPIPKIRNLDEDPDGMDEEDLRPWVDAVPAKLVRGGNKSVRTVWWANDTPLMRELFENREDLDDDEDEDDDNDDDE